MEPTKLQDVTMLRKLIDNLEITEPIVLKGVHSEWDPCKWPLDLWGKIITKDDKDKEVLFCRVGQQNHQDKEPQWEAKTGQIHLTWKKLTEWSDPKRWVYYDYKNIVDVIDRKYFKNFEWNHLGFPDREGSLSNLWIGTAGSYTPCHFDTYGCNLVTQIYGRKTWILFPPSDTIHLHPSRIPYEESSVFSLINFCSPSPCHHGDLAKCNAVMVTLMPGDCLFVPTHWWHFVKSDEFSISVNTWIEQEQDHLARLQEASIRFVVGSIISLATPDTTIDILNPNEEDLTETDETCLSFLLRRSYEDYTSSIEKGKEEQKSLVKVGSIQDALLTKNGEPSRKKRKTNFEEFLAKHPFITKLTPYHFNLSLPSSSTSANNKPTVTKQKHFNHLINAIGHPHILKLICEQFIKNVANDN